ncbi:hypothetical protein FNH22_24160 [Fulvivirga sp. M361]|uniref:sensor histidine kinase n=1 Tax=Fulvivirga sp. M361 TaxID=2594266 RepID=UPI00117A84E4|nr:sensor histidine kinase [Fulvivirga sp. M361]TRX51388.1 hypothetical protein FNH22_24160 [Fulvivirga sp. M361]
MRFCLSIVLFTVLFLSSPLWAQNESEYHFVDLRHIDFNNDQAIELDYNWLFYWKQLLTPDQLKALPDHAIYTPLMRWQDIKTEDKTLDSSFGYATYHLSLLIADNLPLMALQIPYAFSSSKVWINNKLILQNGNVAKTKKETRHLQLNATIPFSQIGDTLDIVIQVANFYHNNGGLIEAPILGTAKTLLKKEKQTIMADMIFIGSLMFIGMSFLFLFFFFWNKDKAILYFSVLCIFWSYRSLSDGYAPLALSFEWLPWIYHVKLEYIAMFSSGLCGSMFLSTIFKKFSHRLYPKIITWLISAFILLTVLAPSRLYTQLLNVFLLLMGVNLLYAIIVVFIAAKNKLKGSSLATVSILLGTLVLGVHVLTHIFFNTNDLNVVLLNSGYVVVILLNSFLLGQRFSKSFYTLENLQLSTLGQKKEISAQAEKLNSINNELKEKSDMLKEKNKEVSLANNTLERQVKKRTARLSAINKELDTFLYRSSHDLKQPISSISGLLYLAKKIVIDKTSLEFFDKIALVNNSMDELVSKLNIVSTIKYHQVSYSLVSMKSLIMKLKTTIMEVVKEKNNISFLLSGEDKLITDVFLLEKILYQLFLNSAIWVDHVSTSITITCNISVDQEAIKITVRDNGPGIARKNAHEIFEMYKVGNETVKGHGLGLYIVDKAIEKLNGQIQLNNSQKKGASFTITIPVAQAVPGLEVKDKMTVSNIQC